MKVDAVLQIKGKNKLWKPCDPNELKEVVARFRGLYGDKGFDKKPLATSGLAKDLHRLLVIAHEASNQLVATPPLKLPYSRARERIQPTRTH
jgi:hypothetical protein